MLQKEKAFQYDLMVKWLLRKDKRLSREYVERQLFLAVIHLDSQLAEALIEFQMEAE